MFVLRMCQVSLNKEELSMRTLKTSNCVICGDKAVGWSGHVLAREKRALGNYVAVKIIAGKCSKHAEVSVLGKPYEPSLMGACVPMILK